MRKKPFIPRIQRLFVLTLLLTACLATSLPMVAGAEKNLVDINSASVTELMKVDGMRETWARRIVRFRPYRAKTDLVGKGIVTTEVYQRIKDQIVAHHVAKTP